jgi:hypothetical protein
LLTLSGTVSAIEKFTFIRSADAVAVGELKLSSYFLSFDGLHVNGTIEASEILFGDQHAGHGFEYHLVVPCSLQDAISGVCGYRGVWQPWSETKELFTRKRIWALVKGKGSSWTAVDSKLRRLPTEPRPQGVDLRRPVGLHEMAGHPKQPFLDDPNR